jgi:hypothetical protein
LTGHGTDMRGRHPHGVGGVTKLRPQRARCDRRDVFFREPSLPADPLENFRDHAAVNPAANLRNRSHERRKERTRVCAPSCSIQHSTAMTAHAAARSQRGINVIVGAERAAYAQLVDNPATIDRILTGT